MDLDEIWNYSASKWGEGQAEIYTRKIRTGIDTLIDNPGLGFSCDELRAGYLKYNIEKHTVFYKIDRATLYIVRILHQQMLPERHLN
jgi:toxin ParE1/3/4